jgi:hypothetical protein
MTETLLQEIARRVEEAGWSVREIKEPAWLDVWHSNGDDVAHLTNCNEVWQGFWADRHGEFLRGFSFGADIPDSCTNGKWLAAVIVQRLRVDDPVCEYCGFNGHPAVACEEARLELEATPS